MSVKSFDCAYVDENDLVGLYLGGKLAEADAEAFEQHYLGCERCSSEIERGGEIRAAAGVSTIIKTSRPRGGGRDFWTLLAAAAVVAMLAIGLSRVSRPVGSPYSPVYRGTTGGTLVLVAKKGKAGEVILEWQPHPAAQTYFLKIITSDGSPIMATETRETRLSLDLVALPPHGPGVSFLARVEAIDSMGLVVARSDLESLTIP